jgi:hypothetical protein
MKRWAAALPLFAFAFCWTTAFAEEAFDVTRDADAGVPGTESWSITSPFQEGTNKVEVLAPARLEPGRKYPAVYCLPVNEGTRGNWGHPLEEAKKHDLANRHQAFFVTPSFHLLPWYGDNPERPEVRQMSHLTRAVLPFVESRYPADPKARYAIGFSKSALGALGLFLNDLDGFRKVAVFENWWGVPNYEQWEKWGFAPCYGTRASFDAWNPQHLFDREKGRLSGGPPRVAVLLGGPGARIGVETLLCQLRDRKIPHVEIRDLSMGHTWTSGWLPLAAAALAPEAPTPAQ